MYIIVWIVTLSHSHYPQVWLKPSIIMSIINSSLPPPAQQTCFFLLCTCTPLLLPSSPPHNPEPSCCEHQWNITVSLRCIHSFRRTGTFSLLLWHHMQLFMLSLSPSTYGVCLFCSLCLLSQILRAWWLPPEGETRDKRPIKYLLDQHTFSCLVLGRSCDQKTDMKCLWAAYSRGAWKRSHCICLRSFVCEFAGNSFYCKGISKFYILGRLILFLSPPHRVIDCPFLTSYLDFLDIRYNPKLPPELLIVAAPPELNRDLWLVFYAACPVYSSQEGHIMVGLQWLHTHIYEQTKTWNIYNLTPPKWWSIGGILTAWTTTAVICSFWLCFMSSCCEEVHLWLTPWVKRR